MKHPPPALLALVLTLAAASAAAAPAGFTDDAASISALKAPAGAKQWPAAEPLLAPDLSNAATAQPGAWSSKNGVFTGKGIAWTKTARDNFILSLEFRAQAKADGGLFFRCSDTKDYVQNALEVQIMQGDHPAGNERAIVGALYDLAAPSRQVEIEPEQWYSLLLVADGASVTVYVDNERLVRADLNKWTTAGKNPDGTANKFKRPLAAFARSGVIGFHAAEGKIEYRNLFIDTLPPTPVAADNPALLAFVTSVPWTAKLGKDQLVSTFALRADGTYEENWRGKDKYGKWSLAPGNKIVLKTPDNTTITLVADPAAGVLRRGNTNYTPAGGPKPAAATADNALLAFVTATPWTAKIGKNKQTSTISLRADGTYEEQYYGKLKHGKWSRTDATITLKSPENTTLVFTADPAAGALHRKDTNAAYAVAYKPLNPASLPKAPATSAMPTTGAAAPCPPVPPVAYLPATTPPAETEDWSVQVPVVTVPAPGDAPSDATVLFDGASLAAWDSTNPKEENPLWKVAGGVLTPVDKTGSLRTKAAYGDVQVHLEFRAQTNPVKSGQYRGNSGLLFMGLYEFQVLDSHENPTYSNGQAASIYKQYPPLVNASRKPGEWQTYDVVFIAPRFAADGALLSPARITAFHNGVLVQHDTILTGPTAFRGRLAYTPHPAKLPLVLQNHAHDRPSFRNIWIRELTLPAHASVGAK